MPPNRSRATIAGVTSGDLNAEQIAKLRTDVGRQLRYYNRLCARMQRLGWPADDAFVREGMRVRDSLQDFYTSIHYAGCKIAVSR